MSGILSYQIPFHNQRLPALLIFTDRELRDKLAKAVEESEYKLYEREQLIRREVQRELARRDKEGEVSSGGVSGRSGRCCGQDGGLS